jgi:hypothetical protein
LGFGQVTKEATMDARIGKTTLAALLVLLTILAAAPCLSNHHQLDAVVSEVDPRSGRLLLKTEAGRLTLTAPAAAATHLRTGDRLLLDVALVREPGSERIHGEETAVRAPVLVQRLAAEVVAVRRSMGTASLRTAAGRLDVDLPSDVIASVHTGDRLLLDLSVLHPPESAASPRTDDRQHRAGIAALLLRLLGASRSESQSRQ